MSSDNVSASIHAVHETQQRYNGFAKMDDQISNHRRIASLIESWIHLLSDFEITNPEAIAHVNQRRKFMKLSNKPQQIWQQPLQVQTPTSLCLGQMIWRWPHSLNSSQIGDSDPLLVHLTPSDLTPQEARAYSNPDKKMERKARRKDIQRQNKHEGHPQQGDEEDDGLWLDLQSGQNYTGRPYRHQVSNTGRGRSSSSSSYWRPKRYLHSSKRRR